jgi:hypothetical protein
MTDNIGFAETFLTGMKKQRDAVTDSSERCISFLVGFLLGEMAWAYP